MNKFKVWFPDDCDEEDADEVKALDANHAAEQYMDENHADIDFAPEAEVFVRDGAGKLTRWTVSAEETVEFKATEKS